MLSLSLELHPLCPMAEFAAQDASAVTAARVRVCAAVALPTAAPGTSMVTLPRSFSRRSLAHSSKSRLRPRRHRHRRLLLRRRRRLRLRHERDLRAAAHVTWLLSTSRPVGSPPTTLTGRAKTLARHQRKFVTPRPQGTRGAILMLS